MRRLTLLVLCSVFALILPLRASESPGIFVPLGHSSSVKAMAFSSDGRLAVSGGTDNNIVLWDVPSGREIRTFRGHTSYIMALTFSPDGQTVISGSQDTTTRTWEVATGREMRRFKDIWSATLIPGPEGSVFSGDSFSVVRKLDIQSGAVQEVTPYDGQGEIKALTILPQDNTLIEARAGGFKVVDLKTGKSLRTFGEKIASPQEEISMAFSPDGRLGVMGRLNQIQAWDTQSGKELPPFEGWLDRVYAVAFSPDGRQLIAGGSNYRLRVWDVETRKEIRSIFWYNSDTNGAYSGINALAIGPDGKQVLAAYRGGWIKHWDISIGALLMGTPLGNYPAQKAGLREGDELLAVNGKRLASWGEFLSLAEASPGQELRLSFRRNGTEEEVRLTPASVKRKNAQGQEISVGTTGIQPGGLCLHSLESIKDSISSGSVSADGHFAALGHTGGHLSLWDLRAGALIRTLKPYTEASKVLFAPKGTRFLSTGDEDITVWDPTKPAPVTTLKVEDIGAFYGKALAFTPDGRYVLGGGKTRVTLLDMGTLQETKTLSLGYDSPFSIHALAVSRDARYAASGDGRMKVRIWDLASGRNLSTMEADSWVEGLDFSPNGKMLVSGANAYNPAGTWMNTLKAWEPLSGRPLGHFGGYVRAVNAVKFSADGKTLLTGGDELLLWDVASQRVIRTFAGHQDTIYSASFLADGKQVMSAGYDGTLRLWDLETGRELAQFITFLDGEWVVVTPEGFFNASPKGAKHLSVRMGNAVYGIDQFYSKFYRPEFVKLALAGKTLPRGETLTQLLASKPAPTVQILSPAGGAVEQDEVSVALRVTDQGGGIGNVILYLNGSQVANDGRGLAVQGTGPDRERRFSFTIPLNSGTNEIRVVAFNQENSMESNPAMVTLRSRMVLRKPNLYALVIGINEYKNKSISLTYAVPDAKAFAEALQRSAAPLFEQTHIRLLTTPETTTKAALVEALKGLRTEIKPNDLFVFYDASHGVVDTVDDEEQYFLLTSNILLLSSRHLGTDALGQKELARLLGNLSAQKKLVILDTCNAGKGGKEIQIALLQQTRGLTEATAVKLLQRAVGSAVFSASSDTQLAIEGYKGHGLFTYVLLEGLLGKADLKKDGYITVLGLADYLEEQVTKLSEEVFKRQQTPIIQTGANFPIGRIQ